MTREKEREEGEVGGRWRGESDRDRKIR